MRKCNAKNYGHSPYISVIMAAYNSETYIASAIESILGQTFPDFELIIIDDASTDRTADIIKKYTDKRMRFIKKEKKLNQAACRNAGILQARGMYIAIMDSDDIALPQRLATQSVFLDAHPEVTVVGSWYYKVDKEGNVINLVAEPESDSQIKLFIALKTKESCFCHPATMFRKDSILAIGGYDENTAPTEDKDLWIRLAAKGHVFANLRTPLLKKREVTSFGQEHLLKQQIHKTAREIVYIKNRTLLESLYKKYKKCSIKKIPSKELTVQERSAYAELYIRFGLGFFYCSLRRQARPALIETIKCAYKPFANITKTSHIAYFLFLETLSILKWGSLRRIYYVLATSTSNVTYFTLLQKGNFPVPPSTFTILLLFFRTFFSKESLANLIGIKRRRLLNAILEMAQQRPTIEEEISVCVNRMFFFVGIFDFEQENFLVFGDATNTISSILRARGKNVMRAESVQDLQRSAFSGEQFDYIFCLKCFEDLTEPEVLLRQFITALRLGGYVYCYFYAPHILQKYRKQDVAATETLDQHSAAIRKIQQYDRFGDQHQGVIRKVFFRQIIETNGNGRVFQTVSGIELLFRKD